MNEQAMRTEIEAAGLRVVQIGPLFGADLDAIVENARGQFLWSVYRPWLGTDMPAMTLAATKRPVGQQSLF